MADVKNNWVGYLDRSYQQIKLSLLSRLGVSNPEMSDHSDSNPLVIFINAFSGIGEMLGFYVDNAARESHVVTARRRSSVIMEARAKDYRVKARAPESVDLLITWNAPIAAPFVLQAGLTIANAEGVIYRLLSNINIPAGVSSYSIPIVQVTPTTLNIVTDGTRNQKINLGTSYVQSSLDLVIDSVDYTEVSTFANSPATARHYIIDVEEDGNAYVILGDGINGALPTSGLSGTASYNNTLGPAAKTGAGEYNDLTITLGAPLPGGVSIVSANSTLDSSGGALYEDTEKIRNNSVRSLRTLERMVSFTDHEYIMNMLAGVAKSKVDFSCGKNINLYIVPTGGGIAQSLLLAQGQALATATKMVATFPVVLPAGETRLILRADVTARKRKSLTATKTQVESALLQFGQVENQEINGAIRLSDIQALIDNQSNVDFVDLVSMYTVPYARPIGHTNILNWVNQTTSFSLTPVSWRLEYDGLAFRVFRDTLYLGNISIGSEFAQPDFKFTIAPGSYVLGNSYEFTVMPFLKNLQLVDFTIFTIKLEDLSINVLANASV